MDILLNQVEIVDKRSPFHRKKVNVRLKDGAIAAIGEEEQEAAVTVDAGGLMLSIGWFDMQANFGDPGHEYKEDLETGSKAAAAGGFTEVAILPNTAPTVQTKNEISYIKSKSSGLITELHPIAAVTLGNKGEELTEMIDLYEAGAVAFSDGEKPLWHTDICLKALLYLQKFNGLLIDKPYDKLLTAFGTMNEGIHSTMMGMKGLPALAEELAIIRDLDLLAYSGGKLHIANISTARAVALIRDAKAKGLDVSCDIAAHQVMFEDSDFYDFDTNYKVNPPFRSREDIEALMDGLKDNTIDIVVSSHSPQDEESKKLEFDMAEFGVIGLQTVFPNLVGLKKRLDLASAIEKITVAPRKRLGLELPEIKVGSKANLTLFDPKAKWVLNDASNRSKAKNSPFYNKELTGRALGVFNKGKYVLEEALLHVS